MRAASTELTLRDHLGSLRVRFGIARKNYRIDPGLYTIGSPDQDSPVLVSSNYKLTFDSLRKELKGLDCYLIVLDTKGINVWCAAGKGTFGATEIANRIERTNLEEKVSHRILILPQLGASGVNAHEVKRLTGFDVVYGPVRAKDVRRFLADGMVATEDMRTVKFTIRDRVVLTPVEVVSAMKISLLVFGLMFLANLVTSGSFGMYDLCIYMGAVLTGTVVTPILLPFIPGRAFSLKGWVTGFMFTAFLMWRFGWFEITEIFTVIGYLMILPSVSAYFAMNFTGSSTYTSPSGVYKEMKVAIPLIIATVCIGIAALFWGKIL